MSSEPALERSEAGELTRVVADVSIAPLGRNYFSRYREIRDRLAAMSREVEGAVAPAELREYVDGDDLEFLDSIVSNLRTFAEEGMRREGSVEPYTSARADADRLEPYLDLLRPHLEG